MSIIIAKDISKDYKTKSVVSKVIKNVSLEVAEGEFVAITGPSGSGKSTLLYLLSGLETPTKGSVAILGKNLQLMKEKEKAEMRRKQVSFIYQFYNLVPNLTLYENIVLPIRMKKRLSPSDKAYLEELINLADIKKALEKRPEQVSGGEQQRAAFVRALFTKPQVIFADEPTGNLDSKAAQTVMELIKKINVDYKTTIVMVTHSKEFAKMATRTINIQDGKILN